MQSRAKFGPLDLVVDGRREVEPQARSSCGTARLQKIEGAHEF